MKAWTSILASLLALTALVLVVARADAQPPQQQARTDRLLYSVPPGWTRTEQEKYTVLHAPNLPAGKAAEIRILPASPLAGPLQAVAMAEGEQLKRTYAQVQLAPVNVVRHPNGFEMAIAGASMASPGAPGQFVYNALAFVRAGDQVQLLLLHTSDFALHQSHKVAFDALLHNTRVTDSILLAQGNPPLTQATVDSVTDFVEWLIEVPFTEEQKQVIAREMVDSWKKNVRDDIQGTQDILKMRAQLSAMSPEQKALARQQAQPQLIKAARSETDAIAKMIVQVYDAAHKPIAPGNPPLTRQAADAMLEVLFFMASQVQSGDSALQPTATPQMKDQWAKNLAANYAKTDAAARQAIASMPITWAQLRLHWPDVPQAEKAKARAQWARSSEVKQVAEMINALGQRSAGSAAAPAPSARGQKYWAEGRNVMMSSGDTSWTLYAEESEAAAKKRAAELNKENERMLNPAAADARTAADMMAERTRDYAFTKSMLNMGYNNTIMQMGAISGRGWRYR
jgi:hypothetical protein